MKLSIDRHKQLTNRFKLLSVNTKTYLYIFSMGLIGAAIGAISTEVDAQNLNNLKPDVKIQQVGMAAFAGMGAATVISFSSLLKED